MDWTIRPATRDDEAAIREAITAAGVAAWSAFLGEERIRRAVAATEQPADLVAEDEQGVFAFVAWDPDTGEILRLYTHPRASGRGAGGALLDRALEALKTAGRMQAWLNTEERNRDARRFYVGRGWREAGPARVRDWHGTRIREPRYVKDL